MKRRPRTSVSFVALFVAVAAAVGACQSPDGPTTGPRVSEQLVADAQQTDETDNGSEMTPDALPIEQRGWSVSMAISDGPVGFDVSYPMTRELGIDETELSVAWDDLEPSPGVFGATPDFLAIANAYYPAEGVSLGLTIAVLDTNQDRRPADVQALPLDDPVVIDRFRALLDYLADASGDLNVTTLSIGNEVDIWLSGTGEWAAYTRFFDAVAPHARGAFPGVPIGVKTTVAGYRANPQEVRALHDGADAIFLTHYLIDANFTAEPAHSIHAAFDDAVAIQPGKPVRFLELGAPSDPMLGASEAEQAAFVVETFKAWDDHATQLDHVAFTWSTDIGIDAVEAYYDYYGIADGRFGAYLGSIGFIRVDGTPKPAYLQLHHEIAIRNL